MILTGRRATAGLQPIAHASWWGCCDVGVRHCRPTVPGASGVVTTHHHGQPLRSRPLARYSCTSCAPETARGSAQDGWSAHYRFHRFSAPIKGSGGPSICGGESQRCQVVYHSTAASRRQKQRVMGRHNQPRGRAPSVGSMPTLGRTPARQRVDAPPVSREDCRCHDGRPRRAGTDLPPIRWAIGSAAVLVPPGNPDALVEAIIVARDNRDQLRKVADRARTEAEARFTPEKVAPLFAFTVENAVSSYTNAA